MKEFIWANNKRIQEAFSFKKLSKYGLFWLLIWVAKFKTEVISKKLSLLRNVHQRKGNHSGNIKSGIIPSLEHSSRKHDSMA